MPRAPQRGRRPQVVEEMVRPARFERATYRFVARTGERVDHHRDVPRTTKDGQSDEDGSEKYTPSRDLWPGESVNAGVSAVLLEAGRDEYGEPITLGPARWLATHRAVHHLIWHGEPEVIEGRLVVKGGGYAKRPEARMFNLYVPPALEPGNRRKAARWVRLVHRLYPGAARHIIRWLAHRVQYPGFKVNHAIVLHGVEGVGKDSILAPIRWCIGESNFQEASPKEMLAEFNPWAKAVILRISEARDKGEWDKWALAECLKTYLAAPPEFLTLNEKHLKQVPVVNVMGVVITTNYLDSLAILKVLAGSREGPRPFPTPVGDARCARWLTA